MYQEINPVEHVEKIPHSFNVAKDILSARRQKVGWIDGRYLLVEDFFGLLRGLNFNVSSMLFYIESRQLVVESYGAKMIFRLN